jgi:outer membrane protein assembly factor BamB
MVAKKVWVPLCGFLLLFVAPSSAMGSWTQYLGGPQHTSLSAASAFTPGTAAPRVAWHWTPPVVAGAPRSDLDATPIVSGGRVYVGSRSGVLYALDATTGGEVWHLVLDTTVASTCPASRGITATPAFVRDPRNRAWMLYAAGARYLYAIRPATGAIRWKTRIGPADNPGENGYYNWSSPTVVAGHIYIGLSSQCDAPLIRGGVVELNQHTGAVMRTWYSVPPGSIGGSVWSSVAATADGTRLWVTTGNDCGPTLDVCPAGNQVGDSLSIVELSGTLQRLAAWRIPDITDRNSDFGSSPTLFGAATSTAASSVGACNKNGVYYTFARDPLSAQPLWDAQIGVAADGEGGTGACLASAIWNESFHQMFVAGNQTAIGGVTYGGSIRSVDPTNGSYLWQTGLPCGVLGTPSENSASVIAVPTVGACINGQPAVYLIDAASGAIITSILPGSRTFAQPVFDGNNLFIATENQGLYALAPS